MSVTPEHSVGARIRDLRVARGWSQEEVARRIDVRSLAVGKWERGQANPSTENRAKLAVLFDVDPAELGVELYAPTSTPPVWFAEYVAQQKQQQDQLNAALMELRELLDVLINR